MGLDPVGQGDDGLGFGSVMAHLLGTEKIPGLCAAARGGRRVAGAGLAGANDDVLSPRLQPKTDASLVVRGFSQ